MTPNEVPSELANLLAKYGEIEKERRRPIRSRYYNLEILKDGEVVEVIEYVAANQIRRLKAEYHADGFSVNAIEDVTVLETDEELVFHGHTEPEEKKGVGGFGTPEATRSIIERDRNKARARAAKRDGRPNGKTVRRTDSFRDPKSPLYPDFVRALRKDGFIVKNLNGKTLFIGFQKETAEFIYDLIKNQGMKKSDLDIRFLGA